MRHLRIVNTRCHSVLGARIAVADGWLARLRGMIARPPLRSGEGLLLTPCRSVHMYGMRFPLDVLFLDSNWTVVASYPSLRPGGRTRWHGHAVHALELPAGALQDSGTVIGDVLLQSPEPTLSAHDEFGRAEAVS